MHIHGHTLDDVPKENHTPIRPIRIPDERWSELGEVYGERKRSTVINEVVAWLLREQGAKLPARPPRKPRRAS